MKDFLIKLPANWSIRKIKEALSAAGLIFLSFFSVLIFSILLLGFFEFFFFHVNRINGNPRVYLGRSSKVFGPHPVVGDTYLPNLKNVQVNRMRGRDIIWSHRMSTDSFSRRITPSRGGEGRAAVFFGCSMLFGFGVEDYQTLPAYFNKIQSGVRAYNYGQSGRGAHEMLAWLESGRLRGQVPEEVTLGIYVMIYDHIWRAAGHFGTGDPDSISYELENNVPVRKGTFRVAHPWRTFLFDVLAQSEILRFFKIGRSRRLSEGDYQLYCRIVQRSHELFQRQFPKARFLVMGYETYRGDGVNIDKNFINKCFSESGIEYYGTKLLDSPGNTIEEDGHPSPQGNFQAARWLWDLVK